MDPWIKIANLSPQEIKSLQNQKLKNFIRHYVYPFSPNFRQIFDQKKINPHAIQCVEDLWHIPFTSKKDFLPTEERPDKFHDFVLQPDKEKIRQFWPRGKLLQMALQSKVLGKDFVQERISREFRPMFTTFTTGTTNRPVAFLYSEYDIQNLHLSGARMLRLFNITPEEKILNMFPYAPHLAFWQVVFGGMAAAQLILSTGGGKTIGTDGNISALAKMKPAVVLGVPSYVYHVFRCAKEQNADLSFVKKVVLGAAKVSEAFKMRLASLLESMGARDVSIFGTYGFTEARCAWAECPTSNDISSGYHLYPDKEIFEIVDPETGEAKKEGEDGEIVYTSIDSRTSSVVRYRTGDFVKGGITYEPCPHCKRTVPRLSSDIARLSDTKDFHFSKIKGTLVNMNNLDNLLTDLDCVEEWQIEIKKKNDDPFDIDELIVYVSTRGGKQPEDAKELIKRKLAASCEVTPNEVVVLPFKEMVKRIELETATKEKRILDKRPKS